MCGFCGLLLAKHSSYGDLEAEIVTMTDQLTHRGPDDSGYWYDNNSGIAFGHRRLSIQDLSSAGKQPMVSDNSRYTIVFNGEIYNHLEIRKDFFSSTHKWLGHSDTETLLALISSKGLENSLDKLRGMFAFALWDKKLEILYLVRDRFGEKPLYYGWTGCASNKVFVFGSELKSLKALKYFDNSISKSALSTYLSLMYIPSPLSIYNGISKLEPGYCLTLNKKQSYDIKKFRWWSSLDIASKAKRNPIVDDKEAIIKVEQSIQQSVKLQTIADVPLGAFLSGGIDSSLIVSLMQSQSSKPIDTFTIGFHESEFDESSYARAIANHLGTSHTEIFIQTKEARDVIPLLPTLYDEPFSDSSQIPTYLVCRAARQNLTVALSGDGGDELFGGYNRYFWKENIWKFVNWAPYLMRRNLGKLIQSISVEKWNAMNLVLGTSYFGDKAYKMADRLLHVRNTDELYWSLVTEWKDPTSILFDTKEDGYLNFLKNSLTDTISNDFIYTEKMMLYDTLTYLTDDILCKVDRAAMGTSLETRVPFLDPIVFETAWRLPLSMKIRGEQSKWVLREILYKYVPKKMIERPKAGFGIPIGQWLRGPLKEWAEALIDEKRLLYEGYLKPKPINKIWREHVSEKRDWTHKLWAILMFQSWLEQNK